MLQAPGHLPPRPFLVITSKMGLAMLEEMTVCRRLGGMLLHGVKMGTIHSQMFSVVGCRMVQRSFFSWKTVFIRQAALSRSKTYYYTDGGLSQEEDQEEPAMFDAVTLHSKS